MKPRLLILILLALGFSSCELDSESSKDPKLLIIYNANCTGRRPPLNISVNGEFWGTLAPGQDIERRVKAGTNIITGDRGYGSVTVYVPDNGYIFNITCR